MTMDYAPSLIFTLSLDVILKKIKVDDLQKQLEDIKTQLSIVTKVLVVVTELLAATGRAKRPSNLARR